MRNTVAITIALAVLGGSLVAQEEKPVPKNSVRVSVPGCARDYLFTAGRRTSDEAGSLDIPEGMRLRMAGPKKLMTEIRIHEGSMIEITGTMKKGQRKPDGIGLGGGVRVGPSGSPGGGGIIGNPIANQIVIDVEGWRQIVGDCPSR
jgi:hypothetical protein